MADKRILDDIPKLNISYKNKAVPETFCFIDKLKEYGQQADYIAVEASKWRIILGTTLKCVTYFEANLKPFVTSDLDAFNYKDECQLSPDFVTAYTNISKQILRADYKRTSFYSSNRLLQYITEQYFVVQKLDLIYVDNFEDIYTYGWKLKDDIKVILNDILEMMRSDFRQSLFNPVDNLHIQVQAIQYQQYYNYIRWMLRVASLMEDELKDIVIQAYADK